MNCEGFQTIAADLARDQKRTLMDAGVRAAAQAHVADCQNCAHELLDQISLSEGLRDLAEHMQGWQAPAAVEAGLLESFRYQRNASAIGSRPQRWRYWAVAAAAMLLLGFGLLGLWITRAPVATGPQPVAVKDSQPAPAASAGSSGHEDVAIATVVNPPTKILIRANTGRRRSRNSATGLTARNSKPQQLAPAPALAALETENREIATAFVPVGYGSALDLQDGGQLVRVELPRFALARFGLPMNMDRADETIKADVLLGADGLARAIRFVK